MPCGCGGGIAGRAGKGGSKDPVVDIEHLLVDYAWREAADPSLCDRLMRRRRYRMDVNWSYFDIRHRVVDFQPRSHLDLHQLPNAAAVADGQTAELVVAQRELCLFR